MRRVRQVEEIDTGPHSSDIGIRHMLKEIVNTVALQGDGFVEFADCIHVAIRHQGRFVMEIESCAGFDGELVAHSQRVVDKIGFA